jgi:hypothetical protein
VKGGVGTLTPPFDILPSKGGSPGRVFELRSRFNDLRNFQLVPERVTFLPIRECAGSILLGEARWVPRPLIAGDPAEDVPTGFAAKNSNLQSQVTVYWDKLAMSLAEGDPNKGVVTSRCTN